MSVPLTSDKCLAEELPTKIYQITLYSLMVVQVVLGIFKFKKITKSQKIPMFSTIKFLHRLFAFAIFIMGFFKASLPDE